MSLRRLVLYVFSGANVARGESILSESSAGEALEDITLGPRDILTEVLDRLGDNLMHDAIFIRVGVGGGDRLCPLFGGVCFLPLPVNPCALKGFNCKEENGSIIQFGTCGGYNLCGKLWTPNLLLVLRVICLGLDLVVQLFPKYLGVVLVFGDI